MEIFINGDPRLLSGGTRATGVTYDVPPQTVESLHCSAPMSTRLVPDGVTGREAADRYGQNLHQGKVGYHHTPSYNVFLHDGEWPSAGIELETHLRTFTPEFARAAESDLWSNWFHFERDGSLDRAHGGQYGYELITAPLPPRAYRDARLWFGLQNLCSPWLQSFGCSETGLHVHVGLNQFEEFDAIPLAHPADRRSIGKLLSAVVYYCVADQAFVDRVALRKTTNYCSTSDSPQFTGALQMVKGGGATGGAMVDYCTSCLLASRGSGWADIVRGVAPHVETGVPDRVGRTSWIGAVSFTSGHGTEINQEHPYTIEFRRPKGTLQALSIHRIVELMTSIVRFAGKCCREPDFRVTRDSFMDWIISTTTSEALRNLAKQTKG